MEVGHAGAFLAAAAELADIMAEGRRAQERQIDGEAGIAFGHRRLAIVDLSPLGRQPMESSDGRLVLSPSDLTRHQECHHLTTLNLAVAAGRESYERYIAHIRQGVHDRYGLEVVYLGEGAPALAAEDGQAWDMVVLVRYPSRQAFVDMIADPEYQAGEHHRRNALVEAVLQPMAEVS